MANQRNVPTNSQTVEGQLATQMLRELASGRQKAKDLALKLDAFFEDETAMATKLGLSDATAAHNFRLQVSYAAAELTGTVPFDKVAANNDQSEVRKLIDQSA